jgi:hypothetical protein
VNFQGVVQDIATVANVLNVFILGIGYFLMVRLYRKWVRQSQEVHAAGGRPQVVVSADYSRLPGVSLVVRNFGKAPAKDVTFEFSAPVEDSSGLVISDLPYLRKGLDFMEPDGRLARPWDHLPDLVAMMRQRGLEDGITVTTRYRDLAGESYESEWKLEPLRFENSGLERSRDMSDLVRAVEGLSSDLQPRKDARRGAASARGG